MKRNETERRTASTRKLATATMACALVTLGAFAGADGARAQDGPAAVTGKAILAHPAGKAVVEAAKLLAAGRLGEVKKKSVKEVRDEWATMTPAEQAEETARSRERAPEPKAFEADIARIGVLTIYGETASLSIPTPDGDASAMAFISLEGGQWRVTGGPMTFAPPPAETAPPIAGAAILEHPIGALALEYAKRLEAGRIDSAIELLSDGARAKRAAEPAAERKKSDEFRRRQLPPAATFAEQIRAGGELRFVGESAYLNVVSNVTIRNPDGTTTFTSSTMALPFELQNGAWRLAD